MIGLRRQKYLFDDRVENKVTGTSAKADGRHVVSVVGVDRQASADGMCLFSLSLCSFQLGPSKSTSAVLSHSV